MSANNLTIETQDRYLRPAREHVTLSRAAALRGDDSQRLQITSVTHTDRIRWATVLAGLVVVVLLLVMAGCGGDADDPAVPTSLAPGTAPAATSGVGVPLEPGSNLPPVEGDNETITTSTG